MLQRRAGSCGADVADEGSVPLHHVVTTYLPRQGQTAANHLAAQGADFAVVVVAPPGVGVLRAVQRALAVGLGGQRGGAGHALAQGPHPGLALRPLVPTAAGRLGFNSTSG